MTVVVNGEGPTEARVMVVGEAPGADEERLGRPFVGAAGAELDRMLAEAGLHRSTCFITNVSRQRPPNNKIDMWMARRPSDTCSVQMRDYWVHPAITDGFTTLLREIELVKPNLIIALGNVPMWSLTGKWGVMEWRGSQLLVDWMGAPTKVIPVVHPAAILRQWAWRAAAISDLRRAARESTSRTYTQPAWRFDIRPSYEQVLSRLTELQIDRSPLPLSFDIETRAGHIVCAAIAWSKNDALCIPFWNDYWSEEREAEILWRLRALLTSHEVVGQNLLFDAQYTDRWWMFTPKVAQDTMISYHTAFCESARDDTNEKTGKKGKGTTGVKKSLDFLASLYCQHYVQWKHQRQDSDDDLWRYNCEDVVRTMEVADGVAKTIETLKLFEPHAFQQSMFWPVLAAMRRGVRIDLDMRDRLSKELKDASKEKEKWVEEVLGHKLNPRSPKQMQALFYSDFAQRPILKRRANGGMSPTLDDDALTKIALREPLLRPLVGAMLDARTLGTLRSTFVQAPLDSDGRMRCSYNLCGTLTYRLSSSENAFGTGANLQNIPSEKSKVNVKVAKRGTGLVIPNIRSMFIPDEGYTFFDMDLERADLQVVAWEADDPTIKAMLREGADIHSENAKTLGINRELAKTWVHGTNYGGQPRTMAQQCGVTVHAATQLQRTWFAAHPGIEKWHARIKAQLESRKWIENKWGYRWYVFDRTEGMLPEALAWIPQSTVAILINRIWKRIHDEALDIQVNLQVHDSLAGQFPTSNPQAVQHLLNLAHIPIPYDDPLVIPAGVKTSAVSWGACG